MNKSLVRFEYEKSPLHTIFYGGTGTGKTYFIKQYLKLYLYTQSGYTDKNPTKTKTKICEAVW